MKRTYLCSVTDPNGLFNVNKLNGIIELKNFLRKNRVRFGNDDLSHLDNDSVIFKNCLGYTFEVEVLFCDAGVEQNETYFIPISDYVTKYKICTKTVYNAINDKRLRAVKLGNSTLVQDIKIPRPSK